MSERFDLPHARGRTRHLYGAGALDEAPGALAADLAGRDLFLISSDPILERHRSLVEPLLALGARAETLVATDGEAGKAAAEAERLWRRLAALGARRDSVVIAFGGGSVVDLGGFVAGTFHRGIGWVAVPTTLLAQVDAAVGGKTAIDLPEAKNAVGLFHPPLAVVADPAPLATLDRAAIRAGLVEALKTGAVLDAALFDAVEAALGPALEREPGALAAIALGAARVKAALVETDLEEAGARALLNFGHTAGHAFEAAAGFGALSHGDAVAHGIGVALRLSEAVGLPAVDAGRIRAAVDRLGTPPLPALDPEAVLRFLARDKKARDGGVAWVLLDRIGAARYGARVESGRVEAAIRGALLRPGSESL